MEPTPELIRQIQESKIASARRMTFEQRFLAGPELFEFACEVSRDGIRMQFPDADDQRVEQILRERIDRSRRREQTE
jgi:hypothetical protein